MKRFTILIAMIVFAYSLSGQGNSYRYPVTIGMGTPGTVTGGVLNLRGLTSGSVQLKSPDVAGTGTIFQFPGSNGTNGYLLSTNGSGVTSWIEAPATGYTNLTSFIAQTNWRVFYSNGSGDVTELALGADGTYLRSNGATSAPTFATPTTTGIAAGDTADMLTPYATTLEVRDEIADSLNALRANAEAGSAFYALHAPDTVQHTANYTVAASDYRKDQHLYKATSIIVTIPADLTDWPVGGIINFYSFGAGITVFKKGSGVVFVSDLDSIATARGKQDVSIKKIATNKYKLIGPLTD